MSKTIEAKKLAHAEHEVVAAAAEAHDHPLVRAAGAVTELADQPPLIVASIATLTVGAALRRPDMARAGARMLAAHLIATAIKSAIKGRIDRTRPRRALEEGQHQVRKGQGTDDPSLNSFPSGHTAGAVAVAQAVAHDLPGTALPARAAAAGVGALQLPRGKHYLSDVAAGAAIGWLSERLASAVIDAAERALTARSRARGEQAALEEAQAHPS